MKFQTSSSLPTRYGDFRLDIFTDARGIDYMAVVAGKPDNGALVRIHSECATGDILGSLRCDCRDQLESSLKKIAETGQGVLIHMRGHEGRGIGLVSKIKAYALQDKGMDTVDANLHLGFKADQRSYDAAIGILKHYGISKLRLLTNNRDKVKALQDAGIEVTETVPHWTATNPHNEGYIDTKQKRMGHIK